MWRVGQSAERAGGRERTGLRGYDIDFDGGGPLAAELVVGGGFTIAGGASAESIAHWDGSRWGPIGGGTSGPVYALGAWDPDAAGPLGAQLVAAGDFAQAGEATVNNIARWDGSAWRPLGGGLPGSATYHVAALLSWDPDGNGPMPERLVAGGKFTGPVNGLALWNGSVWLELGGGVSGTSIPAVYALTTWDPDGPGPLAPQLIAGGSFTMAGTIAASNIARWDGAAWHTLGAGVGAAVRALTTWDPDGDGPLAAELIAAGDFGTADGQPANRVARWNGTSWQPFDLGLSSTAYSIMTWDSDGAGPLAPLLVAAGSFRTAGALSVERVAWWNGSSWLPFGGGIAGFYNGAVQALSSWDSDGDGPLLPRLVCVGNFTSVDIDEVAAHHVARWDGATWQPFGAGLNELVHALTLWDADGDGPGEPWLVSGGNFSASGGIALNHVARWDGSGWMSFGAGTSGTVLALASWDADGPGPLAPQLIAGGTFETAGGVAVNDIARWDGVAWHALGTGTGSGAVRALATWDPDGEGPLESVLVASGNFSSIGGVVARNIAYWDRGMWHALGAGVSSAGAGVRTVTSWDMDGEGPLPPTLIAGGVLSGVRRWDGSGWQVVGGLVQGPGSPEVCALASWDHDGSAATAPLLVIGGEFTTIGGTSANAIAGWNGQSIQAFATGMEGVAYPEIWALAIWDVDGAGPLGQQVVAAGEFRRAGGVTVNSIGRWDGNAWHPFGTGVSDGSVGSIYALQTWGPGNSEFGPRVVAGGTLTSAGGSVAHYVAAWNTLDPEIVVTEHPENVSACRGTEVVFTVAVSGSGTLTYRWRRDGQDLSDGAGESGSTISGSATPILTISALSAANTGSYNCRVSSACGVATSDAATLEPLICPGPGDLNCDGAVDFFDIDPFLLALLDPTGYAAAFPGCEVGYADMNGVSAVNFFDIDPFVACLLEACP